MQHCQHVRRHLVLNLTTPSSKQFDQYCVIVRALEYFCDPKKLSYFIFIDQLSRCYDRKILVSKLFTCVKSGARRNMCNWVQASPN